MFMAIRDARPSDFEQLVALNNLEAGWVGIEESAHFQYCLDKGALFKVSDEEGRINAFLTVMDENSGYTESPYFNWFMENEKASFLYVDRIVVAPDFRGMGLATQLYEDMIEAAGRKPILCEVSIDPMNDISMRFHKKFGFKEVGVIDSASGEKCSLQKLVLSE